MNESIQLGPVELQVKSFDEIKSLYVDFIGLKILEESDTKILLGEKDYPILEITQNKDLKPAEQKSVGLYHIAIVFPSQVRLAKTILKIFTKFPELFEGSADHLATEAFYFHDFLGNGIELYYDKPRQEWPMENGKPAMGSEYLDPREFLQNHFEEKDNDLPLKVGHIHLKVSDIQKAKDFYIGILNFDEIFNMPTALFVSYDNYHHHFGLNIWESANAPVLQKNTEGLKGYTIKYLNKELFAKVVQNIKSANIKYTQQNNIYTFEDPFGISINLLYGN